MRHATIVAATLIIWTGWAAPLLAAEQPGPAASTPLVPQAEPVIPQATPVIPQAEPVIIDRIAAIVNQDVITLSEVQEAVLQQARVGALPEGTPHDPAAIADRLTPEALQQQLRLLINNRLQLQAADRLGLTVGDAELRQAVDDIKTRNRFASDEELAAALAAERLTLDQYRQQLRREILLAKLINREVRSQVVVSDDESRRYYTDHAEAFSLPQRVKLRQIFLAAPAADASARASARVTAQSVLDRLREGAPFDQLARRYSDGPEAKEGGVLGWFAPGTLMPALEEAAFTLPQGRISDLLGSPAGWHILLIEEREGHQLQPFEQVKETIRKQLQEQQLRDRYEEWFLELRGRAYVDIRL
jgi:peptidyl-prolyl cis-trans isomerase SurA